MITMSDRKIIRFDLKGDYRVVQEYWYLGEEKNKKDRTLVTTCYTNDGLWIGDQDIARFLCKKMGLSNLQKTDPEHCVVSIGFNKKEQKWYGWSHRAIYGFGIGSEVKKGHCAYIPATPQELFDEITEVSAENGDFYQWKTPGEVDILEDGVRIHELVSKPIFDQNGNYIAAGLLEDHTWEVKCGRGEWTALTLEDAKQMAIDFAQAVS
jgi:hypothetical protein